MILADSARLPLADKSVHCVITSPPYWGLRKYAGNQERIWGGLEGCEHEWKCSTLTRVTGGGERPPDNKWKTDPLRDQPSANDICQLCGAWRGAFGLEPKADCGWKGELRIKHGITVMEAALAIRGILHGVWSKDWTRQVEGIVQAVLLPIMEGSEQGEGQRELPEVVPQARKDQDGEPERTQAPASLGNDQGIGREVRVLRGDGTDIPLPGSHQDGRAKGIQEGWRTTRGLEAGDRGGIAQGQVSPALLELQLSLRAVRLLSTFKPQKSSVPREFLGLFEADKCGACYVCHSVDILKEIKRVLRSDGVCFWNIGDSYSGSGAGGGGNRKGNEHGQHDAFASSGRPQSSLKPKDLCLIPFRVALAAQADGWWVRSVIIWAKQNPMPESVTDRPTTAHEYILLLTKSASYYWDAEAVKEKSEWAGYTNSFGNKDADSRLVGELTGNMRPGVKYTYPSTRNLRSVWTFPSQPYSDWLPNFEGCDYVGDDGRPYTASRDCLIHGHLASRRKFSAECGDAQLNSDALRNLDIESRRVAKLAAEHAAKTSTCSETGCHDASALQQKPESRNGSKTRDELTDERGPAASSETSARTNHKRVQSTPSDHAQGSLIHGSFGSASDRSISSHKTGLDPSNDSSCTASEETIFRTPSTSTEPEIHAPFSRTHENSTSEGCASGEPAKDVVAQKSNHSVGNSSLDFTCKCGICQTSHFATFPEELVRRCIAAGTSERGCCRECGVPWERVSERVDQGWNGSKYGERAVSATGGVLSGGTAQSTLGSSNGKLTGKHETTGWRPTCEHGGEAVPCTVLDPFAGSGTVGEVAFKMGRRFILSDLAYQELQKRRVPPMAFIL